MMPPGLQADHWESIPHTIVRSDSALARAARVRKFLAMSYVLGASLGRGATSEVFAVAGDDQLAIKRLHPHLLGDARAVARFAAELERTRAISHPNVARVHAVGDGFL